MNTDFSSRQLPSISILIMLIFGFCLPSSVTANQAKGEFSRASEMEVLKWRGRVAPATHWDTLQYTEIETARLLQMQKRNEAGGVKAVQIGVARQAFREGVQTRLPVLRWENVSKGWVARVKVVSPDAMAVRVGLDVRNLHDRVELRFAGSTMPNNIVAKMSGAELKALLGDDGLFWSPNTDGEAQLIEIFRPKGVSASAARLEAPVLSHLMADSRNTFKIIEKIGESGTCNVDVVCRVNELGQAFVNAKNAVAHMRYVKGGGTFICTGTLVNDTEPVTQTPYFHTANHCFTSNTSAPPVASQMQTVANTLNTIWNYEASTCNGNVSTSTTTLTGGATYLYSSNITDGMLLRLNNAAPSFAYFIGWNAAALPNGSSVLAIHHPRGDAKMVSQGQTVSFDANQTSPGWTSGTTEGGSSGSGLFTLSPRNEYVLRGGLFGGSAACSNSGSLANSENRDFYSRLDVDFPFIKSYLEPQPEVMNGKRPLLRAR
jgi:lysyl endopeptidase